MESGQLTIKHKKGTASFPTKDTEQFFEPEVLLPDSHVFTMPSHLLAEAIENGIKFTSANDYRPILRCVYAYIECGKFGYCASDTHRLITNETPLGEDYENCNWVISPNTAPIIAKACHNVDNVEITDTSKITVYKLDTTIIYSAKAAGKFPDAKRIIPKDNTITCEVAKSDLTEAIKRILLVAPTENNLIKLVITDGEMRIMADNYARGKSATESVSATSTADITIGFDASKLLDCINAAEDDMVKITFRDASRPILIVDEQNPFKNILLMPMSLN
jgi:DNA polymerase-3 subunit beta